MQDTVQTYTPTFTRAQLAQAFETDLTLAPWNAPESMTLDQQFRIGLVIPRLTPAGLLIHTANVFQWPMQTVELRSQVGRFVLVDYTPVIKPDPDVILVLETGRAANAFHAEVLRFQQARQKRAADMNLWYVYVRRVAAQLLSPLWNLRPHAWEAHFVLNWMRLCIATGPIMPDGIDRSQPVRELDGADALARWS